jgi:multimeric flavodoxin WrbA
MKTVLIVYHSMTGATSQVARAAATGAGGEVGVRVSLRRAEQATPEDVINADGYIFATPENLAAMSGLMKDFFDRTYYAALNRVNGRPYLAMICAGSDGQNAARQLERIALGWRLRAIANSYIVCTNAQTPDQILQPKIIERRVLEHCEELGKTLAAGISLGVF